MPTSTPCKHIFQNFKILICNSYFVSWIGFWSKLNLDMLMKRPTKRKYKIRNKKFVKPTSHRLKNPWTLGLNNPRWKQFCRIHYFVHWKIWKYTQDNSMIRIVFSGKLCNSLYVLSFHFLVLIYCIGIAFNKVPRVLRDDHRKDNKMKS